MPNHAGSKKRHFLLGGLADTEPFSPPKRRFDSVPIPAPDRQSHGTGLLQQIERIKPTMAAACEAQSEMGLEEGLGLQVEFESFPGIELAFESLARDRSGIELMNVRHEGNRTYATIFVPDGKLVHFERLLQDYLQERRNKADRALDHKALINTIQKIRAAGIRALWTDAHEVFPDRDDEAFWWEVWLPVRKDRLATISSFRRLAEMQEIRVAEAVLEFPERTVLLVHASKEQLQHSMMTLNSIAELRRSKETANFFDSLSPEQQPEWLEELLDRIQFAEEGESGVYVCLLDTGVNNGHPLIQPVLADPDLHTVEPAWGTDDEDGHGTGMAGLALVGDLTAALSSSNPVEIEHRIESVKILPQDGANTGDAYHHGYLTTEAVARPEITASYRSRVFGMAITAKDNRDRGRPSAWSAAVDRLAVDAEGENETPRLILLSAGNINDPHGWSEYPASNSSDSIHDPGQAWNGLTVGAYTEFDDITEPDAESYEAVASAGGLSPFSTTSRTWQSHWPLKPDVVFEGGNAANDGLGAVWMPSLSLLTCHHEPHDRLFTTMNATSAATALACRMAAQLMTSYPELWPESIRALMVHSAEWTDSMRQMFLPSSGTPTKSEYLHLVRHCGFGVPNLERALWSVSNSLIMVVEAELYPFKREPRKQPTLRDMNLHRLPWPLTELEGLGETEVEMRVTLSYFIEPNPSNRGFRSRYRYESHGLRFEVKRPSESENDFRVRINSAALTEEEGSRTGGDDPHWLIGKQNRHKGSLHADIWRGSAADLASRGILAVYPSLGWWKTRTALERYNKKARYALIVSIHAPEVGIDLYTAVKTQIAATVEASISE